MQEITTSVKEFNVSDKGEVQFAHANNDDSYEIILMTNLVQYKTNVWYLGTCCSNHMTDNKVWFMKLDKSVRRAIRFGDNIKVTFEVWGTFL